MNEVMKKIFAIAFAAVLGLGVLSCSKEQFPEGTDMTSLRVALTPEPSAIPAAGGSFEAAVVVNQGPKLDVPWELSVDGHGRGAGWCILHPIGQHYRQETYGQSEVYGCRRQIDYLYSYTVSQVNENT